MAYVVSALWRAKEGEEDRIARIIEEMTPPSREEAGNLFYQGHRSPDDPRLFYLYEQYVDESGYQAHQDSDHFQKLVVREAIPNLEDRQRTFYETMVDDRGGLG
jgi:quinol monooxygenase YgiN